MTQYVIGFKSGNTIVVDVKDEKATISQLLDEMTKETRSEHFWINANDMLYNGREIEFFVPLSYYTKPNANIAP